MTEAHDKRPSWESAFPGRMDWEMRLLRYFNATEITVDQGQLNHGVLQIDFNWPLREKAVGLRAIFPSAYPEMRPHVFLRESPEFWPDRHVAPTDGNICLLGRDSAQWRPEDGLGGLLHQQLEAALYGDGAEDPQGEPAEFWWNAIGVPGSYCLVDSTWDLRGAPGGLLTLKLLVDPVKGKLSSPSTLLPRTRGVITEIRGPDKTLLASWTSPLPSEFQRAKTLMVPWQRLDKTTYPKGNVSATLTALMAGHARGEPKSIGTDLWARSFVLVHPIELSEVAIGDGWIFGMDWGRIRDFAGNTGSKLRRNFIPVYRAGKADMGARVPAFSALADKRVAVVGVGALGAPIAIELARNGAAELRLLDHDTVEPGNSVRWPLGASAWGRLKVHALKDHLNRHYPGCEVLPIAHMLGGHGPDALTDDQALGKALVDVDLIIDASASFGVNRLLWNRCRAASVPLVRLGATPTVAGGTVSFHGPDGGCPVCLDPARTKGEVPTPPGSDDRTTLMQPPACGERTFSGADYDLQELSLQAVRIVIAALANPPQGSTVYTLSLQSDAGEQIPPSWDVSQLRPQANCPCQVRATTA